MGIDMVESKAEAALGEERVERSAVSDDKLLAANRADQATQVARLRALKGRRLLFVSGSGVYPSLGRILKDHVCEMIGLGLEVYMVFQSGLEQDKYFEYAREHACFHKAVFADMKGAEAAGNIARAALEASGGLAFAGAWTPHEATQMLCARVQEAMGLTGHDPRCYEVAQDKYLTRKALAEAGLNTAKAVQIFTTADVAKAAAVVGFPMIVKPCTGMGSSGVYKVTELAQLEAVVQRVFSDMSKNWALSQKAHAEQAPMLAETFIEAHCYGREGLVTEFDVECLFWDGELVYGKVLDNWKPTPPYFQDRGFHCPSVAPLDVQGQLIAYCASCVKAMGFRQGNFHMEAWMTSTGPVLIECNPRVGGGSIHKTHEKVWGVSPMTNFLMASLGIPINPPRAAAPQCSYGFMLVNAGKTGTLGDMSFLPEIVHSSAQCVDVIQLKNTGDAVVGIDSGVPEWLAQLDFEDAADSTATMVDEMERVMAQLIDTAAQRTTTA
jgi:biotin carboxylase